MSAFATLRGLFRGRLPGQAVIQVTTRCNARCAQCGMSAEHSFARSNLDPEVVDRILEAVARLGMQAVSFTGGEPLLDLPRLTGMIRKAKKLGIPYVRTGTNGFIFHQSGLFPSVNLGINRLCGGRIAALTGPFEPQRFREGFTEAFTRFFSFAADLGFTIANCCYPMSGEEGAVYQATSVDPLVSFTPQEKKAMLQALKDVVPEFRSRMRLFTPISSLDALISQCDGQAAKTYACRGGLDFFFVDASKGHAYPCGYRSAEDLGPFWEMQELPRRTPSCRRCDWECFRDPSELLGPFGMALSSPVEMVRKFVSRPDVFTTWLTDLRYYLACDTFDGTKPMRLEKLARFDRGFEEGELAASFQ